MTIERFLVWSIDETAGFDAAWATLEGARLRAAGRQVGQRPGSWWTAYELETGEDFVTERVAVESRWEGGTASLELLRTTAGWTVNGEPRQDLARALDCDLAACPLTNTMPVLRQHYTHVRRLDGGGAVITYASGSFRSDLTFDRDGFVLDYPQLGRRVPT